MTIHDNPNLPLDDIISTVILTLLMVSHHRWYIFVLPMFSCTTSLWFRNVCDYLIISMTHCDGAGIWNHSMWKTGIRLSCMVNTIATDTMATLTTQGARASAARCCKLLPATPAGTRRTNNVFMTSKRRRDVVLTAWWRYYCVVCPLRMYSDFLRKKLVAKAYSFEINYETSAETPTSSWWIISILRAILEMM